ncbi:nucleotide-diphospho-sugar transferase [Umbelopsis sp. PMI_123]|nr:nucleotide-diphospho-sugar transferase [Umbelopsis sp. PMI_123]
MPPSLPILYHFSPRWSSAACSEPVKIVAAMDDAKAARNMGSIPLTGHAAKMTVIVKPIRQFKPQTGKANATFVILSHFKDAINNVTDAEVKYGFVDKSMWGYPDWIDQKKAAEGRKSMVEKGIIYGDSESYRHMCRFRSGFFFRHPLMLDYEYYWRVEPNVLYHCDIDYDVFDLMATKKFKYGWTLSLTGYASTLEAFWPTVVEWMDQHPEWLTHGNSSIRGFLHEDEKWQNTIYVISGAILRLSGGFFYERWGDAPVHSVAVALMLPESEVHFFDDTGYTHAPITHCPMAPEMRSRCDCNPEMPFENGTWQCNSRLAKHAPNYKWSMKKFKEEIEPFVYSSI